MAKVDLDETEASLAYLEDWMKIIKELRAAREVVEAAREFDDVCSHGIYVNERISHALLDYDEVINDTNT